MSFFEYFLRASRAITAFLLGILVIEYFRPSVISEYLLQKSLFQLLLNDVFASVILAFAILLFFIYNRFSNFHQNKYTKTLNKILAGFFFAIIITGLWSKINNSAWIVNLYTILYMATAFFVFVSCNNKISIAQLSRRELLKILLYSVLILGLSVSVYDSITGSHGHIKSTLEYFLNISSEFVAFPLYIIIVMYIKVIFTTLITLPTSEIVERKNYEFQSLSYLNNVIANTIDLEVLLKTINQVALNSTNAKYSWIELIDKNKVDKVFSIGIKNDIIMNLHKNSIFNDYILGLNDIVLVKDLRKHSEVNLSAIFHFAKSIIIVPLFLKQEKIGNLILLSDEEYIFNNEAIKILTALRDNISISIGNAKLVEASIEKEKYKQELSLAREMQGKLLPESLPDIPNYSLATFSKSAEIVGGDYYDYVQLKNGNYCFLIGDVSGKGISAAFYMAQLKGVILSSAKESCSGEELLKKANNILYGKMDKKIYITLSTLEINNNEGSITTCRAGHMPAIFKNANSVTSIKPKGIAVGLANAKTFDTFIEAHHYQLQEGETCVLFTDGVNEIRNSKAEEYGIENLKHSIENSVFTESKEIINIINGNLSAFSEGTSQIDDITIFAIKYK